MFGFSLLALSFRIRWSNSPCLSSFFLETHYESDRDISRVISQFHLPVLSWNSDLGDGGRIKCIINIISALRAVICFLCSLGPFIKDVRKIFGILDPLPRRCSSAAKMGSVRDYNLSPLSRREGRKKTKVFHCKEGHQLIPCCHTGVKLCHSLLWKTFVFFLPSFLLRGDRM